MKKTMFAVGLLILSAAVFSALLLPSAETMMGEDVVVIIDAGHGEPDGGAVASDGTKESDLNLIFARKIYEKLSEKGVKCVMTRSDKTCIGEEGNTIHEKKVNDIRARVKIAKKYPNALLLSVHMNTFSSSSVSGTQVFFKANNEKSKAIATELQNYFNMKYQNDNAKNVKPIPSNVYLFNHIDNDCVLLECGFITNRNDLNRLKSEEYQNDIAKSVSEVLIYKLIGG